MKTETRTLILDAAELEFAEQGFAAASLRQVIVRAGVNAAAVHYHFGAKEELISAVFARRIGALTAERLALLDACERDAAGRAPDLERVLAALVGPALRLTADPARGGQVFMRLLGRIMAEPSPFLQEMLNRHFGEVVRRFFAALQRALPRLPLPELQWRFQFIVGAMGYVMADPHNMKVVTGGLCDPADTDTAVAELVTFLAAGLRAPVPARPRRKGRR